MEKQPYGTVLIKADKLLNQLAKQPGMTLQDLAQAAQMTNSTALKILDTLGMMGYVQKNPDKTYELGIGLIRYGNEKLQQMELVQVALPYLQDLQEHIDETIHLGANLGQEVMYVHKLEPRHQTIRMTSKVGICRPLYSSAMGKAILATYSLEERAAYFQNRDLVAFTSYTLTSPQAIEAEVIQAQQDLVAFDREEMELQVFCIGAALVKGDQTIGAFSLSMPKFRLDQDQLPAMIKEIVATKFAIEQAFQK